MKEEELGTRGKKRGEEGRRTEEGVRRKEGNQWRPQKKDRRLARNLLLPRSVMRIAIPAVGTTKCSRRTHGRASHCHWRGDVNKKSAFPPRANGRNPL